VHVVLLCEDEGDNALGQRCLLVPPFCKARKHTVSKHEKKKKDKLLCWPQKAAAFGEREEEGDREKKQHSNDAWLLAARRRAAATATSKRLSPLCCASVCVRMISIRASSPFFPHPKYLDDGDVQKRAAEAHGEGRGRHHGRPGQEAHGHGERRHLVPARDDPRLQRHEQPCNGWLVS
jgi:hypothetical protein